MTDAEVTQLYRCLLGREPEDSGTVAAFKGYYPSVDRGRRAMFASDEFEAFFSRVTGRALPGRDPVAASLALALLARAAAAAPPLPPPAPQDEAIRAGLSRILQHGIEGRPSASFAVVVGESAEVALDDLVPLGQADSAILHIAPGFPPAVPVAATQPDGATVFRLGGDAESIAEILRQFGRRIDALYLLGRPANAAWADVLRPHFAAHTLLVVGHANPGFDALGLSAAIAASHPAEPVQLWRRLHLHHIGGWLLPVTYEPPPVTAAEPDRTRYPSLAIASIVRDEANCVQNMLRSTRPVASFYAVLDTGSVDATPALARKFLGGCGVPSAFAQRDHFAFGDDFAAMRNAALAMVPPGIDWVLMLDADEELAPEDHAALLALIADGRHDAFALPRYNFPGADKSGVMVAYPDRQVRLLRHGKGSRIGYSGVVHETVRGVPTGFPPLDCSAMGGSRGGPHIHHLVRRFRTPEQEERKQAFYREIARRHAQAER